MSDGGETEQPEPPAVGLAMQHERIFITWFEGEPGSCEPRKATSASAAARSMALVTLQAGDAQHSDEIVTVFAVREDGGGSPTKWLVTLSLTAEQVEVPL